MLSNHACQKKQFVKRIQSFRCVCKNICGSSLPLRSKQGSVMVEGAVGLLLVISGLIVAVLFLLNSGLAVYNQEKIGFVANSAASYAANLTNTSTRQADVDAEVKDTMANLGLDSSNTSTTISDVTLNSLPAVSVTITANLPTLMTANFGSIFPQQIQINNTAVALKPVNPMRYLVVVDPLGGQVTVPLINTTGILPNDGLPAWQISLAGVKNIR